MNYCFIRSISAMASAALRVSASVFAVCGCGVSMLFRVARGVRQRHTSRMVYYRRHATRVPCCHRGALASRIGSFSGAHSRSLVNQPDWHEFQTVLQAFDRNALQPSAVRSATTRASTASRDVSVIAMPATRMTARASSSTRSAEIASHFASHCDTAAGFPARNAVCSRPAPAMSRPHCHPWPVRPVSARHPAADSFW